MNDRLQNAISEEINIEEMGDIRPDKKRFTFKKPPLPRPPLTNIAGIPYPLENKPDPVPKIPLKYIGGMTRIQSYPLTDKNMIVVNAQSSGFDGGNFAKITVNDTPIEV